MIDNGWTKRIRELEAENACYAIKEREFRAKIERLELENEALKAELRSESCAL